MGIRGKDFVMLCTDTSAVQQIITIKHDEDKLLALDDTTVLALSGLSLHLRAQPDEWTLCWHLLAKVVVAFGLCSLHHTGEPGDRVQFSEFIKANVKLYALRNQRPLRTSAVANFIRNELATALRQVLLCRVPCGMLIRSLVRSAYAMLGISSCIDIRAL